MLVHPHQQGPVAQTGSVTRKSLSRPSHLLHREERHLNADLVETRAPIHGRRSNEETSHPHEDASAASEESDAMINADGWCEMNSVALLEACCNRDVTKANAILEKATLEDVGRERIRKMVQRKNDFRDTALHLSACNGDVDTVRLLLARGAEVDAENNLGSTPLNRAAVAGKLEVIEHLLDAGANLEHQDDISGTPLHSAARRNHCSTVRLLLNRGASVDVADGVGNRPLHLAAAEGAISVVEVLVKHYADPSLRNIRGQTPLDVARVSWIGDFCKRKIARLLST